MPNSDWNGAETITFKAEDKDGLWADTLAVEGMHHGVHKNLILESASPSGIRYGIGDAGHVFHSSGKYNILHT